MQKYTESFGFPACPSCGEHYESQAWKSHSDQTVRCGKCGTRFSVSWRDIKLYIAIPSEGLTREEKKAKRNGNRQTCPSNAGVEDSVEYPDAEDALFLINGG